MGTVPLILQWDETFDIGADTGTPGAPTRLYPESQLALPEKKEIQKKIGEMD